MTILGALLSGGWASRASAEPWSVQTSLSVSSTLDTNVDQSSSADRRSDVITTLSPNLSVVRRGQRIILTMNGRTNYDLYVVDRHLNNAAYGGGVALTINGLGGRLSNATLDLSDNYVFTKQLINVPIPGDQLGNDGLLTRRTNTSRNIFAATLTRPLTPQLSAVIGYGNTVTKYQAAQLTDAVDHRANARLNYAATALTTLNAAYALRVQEQGDQAFLSHQLLTGVNTAFTPMLTASLNGGVSYFTASNQTFLILTGNVTKQFEYAQVWLNHSRQVSYGGGLFKTPAYGQSVRIGASRTMGPNGETTASVTAGYRDTRATQGGTTKARTIDMSATIRQTISQWLSAGIDVRHINQHSSGGAHIRNETITLTLTGAWSSPIP
ncbi:MAG: hypothetical protein AB1515_00250 [Nitrospirota bacterium]